MCGMLRSAVWINLIYCSVLCNSKVIASSSSSFYALLALFFCSPLCSFFFFFYFAVADVFVANESSMAIEVDFLCVSYSLCIHFSSYLHNQILSILFQLNFVIFTLCKGSPRVSRSLYVFFFREIEIHCYW